MGVVNNLIFRLGLLRKLAQAESPSYLKSYLKNFEILGKNGHNKSVLKKEKKDNRFILRFYNQTISLVTFINDSDVLSLKQRFYYNI